MTHDPLQARVDLDRSYTDWAARLRAEDAALREEHRRLKSTPAVPDSELQRRVRELVQAQSAAARQSLQAAIDAGDLEELGKLIPPVLFAVFPTQLAEVLVGMVRPNEAARTARLREIEERNRQIETVLARGYEEYRAASAPVQG